MGEIHEHTVFPNVQENKMDIGSGFLEQVYVALTEKVIIR